MRTSDRTVLTETAAASVLVLGVIALASPGDVWMQRSGLHPIWFPVIVMAARYSIRGLFTALAVAGAGLVALSLGLGQSLDGFIARTDSVSDILALTTAVLVAWVAMSHESRIARADERLALATEAQQAAEENVAALHGSLSYLRGRQDRLDVSIGLWRSLAGRLERGDAPEAARAVLELCEIRAGARAGSIQFCDGTRFTTVASRGQWSTASAKPQNLPDDATVRAAIASRQVTPAGPGSTELDADVAVPVIDEDSGAVVGVIALRGVSPANLRAPELRDLGVLGQWLAPHLARQLRRQFRKAIGDLRLVPPSKSEAV